MRFKLLAIDVDGTLIGPSRQLTPRVRAAVRATLDAGVMVTLATGRWFRSAQPVAADLGLELPIILHNGAVVRDSLTGAVLYQNPLPRHLAISAMAVIRRHGLQPIVYESTPEGEGLRAGPAALDADGSARYLASKDRIRREAGPDFTLGPGDPIQLVVVGDALEIGPLLAELVEGAWRTVTSMSLAVPDSRFVEVLGPGCSKTDAIRHIATPYGIDLADVMAVGDNFNDLDMIEAAGFGVAMGNAPAAVRARADWVAPDVDEDGLAVAIERWLLTAPTVPAAAVSWSGSAVEPASERRRSRPETDSRSAVEIPLPRGASRHSPAG